MSDNDYLLGHDEREWSRLEEQHALWRASLLEPLEAAGVREGMRVVEVGCGTGALLEDLARLVGPGGRAWGVERDPQAARAAAKRLARYEHVEVVCGDLFGELPGPADAIVARWVFSFLSEPERAAARLADALAPGGLLAIQDYDHDGLRFFPEREQIAAVFEAYRAAYRESGGDLWIAGTLPQIVARLGLTLELVDPRCMAGAPGSAAFRWVERFMFEHIDKLIEGGQLTAAQRTAFEAAWKQNVGVPGAMLITPLQVTILARRP